MTPAVAQRSDACPCGEPKGAAGLEQGVQGERAPGGPGNALRTVQDLQELPELQDLS